MGKRKVSAEEAKQIGVRLGLNWANVDMDQFRRGLEVEFEHGTMTLGFYAPVGNDPQSPHERDEIYIIHAGLVCIFSGGILVNFTKIDGMMMISEQKNARLVRVWGPGRLPYTHDLGFEVRCEDFRLKTFVDGAVNGLAALIGGTSGRLRRLQTGFVRSYALSMFAGAAVLVGAMLLVRL